MPAADIWRVRNVGAGAPGSGEVVLAVSPQLWLPRGLIFPTPVLLTKQTHSQWSRVSSAGLQAAHTPLWVRLSPDVGVQRVSAEY